MDNKYNNNNRVEDMTKQIKALQDIEYALDQSSIVAITDQQGMITYVNDHFCEVSQYDRNELLGQDHRILNSGYHSKSFFKEMWKQIGFGQIWKGEIKNRKKDGSMYWVQTTIVPYLNEKKIPYQYISIRTDITKQKQLEEEVMVSNEKYRLIAENTVNLVSLIEGNGSFQYVSPSFQTLLKINLALLENSNLFELIHPDDVEIVKKEIDSYFRRKKETRLVEFRIRNVNGEYFEVEANISSISSSNYSMNELLLVVIRDTRSRKEIEKKIYHLAYHDALTNFPNRRSFMNQLRTEIEDRKLSRSKMSVLFIDLDNFKSINDQWGHDAGDAVIIGAAQKIRGAIRQSDVPARLGGDEFIVLLKDVPDEEDTISIVKRILTNFQTPIIFNGQEHLITCSIGIANYPEHGESPEELIKNADDSLYNVKERGKNNFILFDTTIQNQSLERNLLETALRNAIKEQQFYLEYQPKLNISTNELLGMEALVRWNHPNLGIIPPGKFIPLAEETGLIAPLGEWILRESCRQTKQWQVNGFPPLTLSVNVSVRQLVEPNFIHVVEEILKETQLHPKWLELEVTESIFADVKSTLPVLREIQKLGVHISVDDFGTGYSSLSYLKHLPINTLKVDASFIKDIHTNEESSAIVKAVLTLANTIGLNVIAEGIELQEHVDELSKDGCVFGQGFYFSKPLNIKDFDDYMKNLKSES
ncbi:EAL domain-containing protein [Solibacillus sp. FSL H8-0538]|uniref:EAL domain-containing protein n=1 Tax=Solibacillus sp. FSL H8-0538 TaxID=2921400 RepID=UPI0030FC296A